MFLFILSSLPVLLIFIFFYLKDKFEKEPVKIMLLAFLGGILSIIPVLFYGIFSQALNIQVSTSAFFLSFNEAFFEAAFPEELSKLFFLYVFIWKNKAFNEYYDGILYAVLVSLGFAWVENIMYVFQGGISVGITRALFAIPGHALFGVLMGYFFSHAKFDVEHRNKYLAYAVLYPVLAHGTYDFILMFWGRVSETTDSYTIILMAAFLGFVIYLWKIALKKTRSHANNFIKT